MAMSGTTPESSGTANTTSSELNGGDFIPDTAAGGPTAGTSAVVGGSVTQVVEASQVVADEGPPTLKLRLKKKSEVRKQVSWTEETVDNEHMGKKKSKSCCIYVKPKKFGESDTESEDEDNSDCDHCPRHSGAAGDYDAQKS